MPMVTIPHVGDRGIGDQLLHVLLHERDQRGVDDRDNAQRIDEGHEEGARVRQHGQREAEEAVAPHLQQNTGEDHRARRRRLHVRVGEPGVERPHRQLNGEGGEEREPEPGLHRRREVVGEERWDIGGASVEVHEEDRQQEQHRAHQRIEEELERRVDSPRAAPNADDQEHRDQLALEEDVEHHEVKGAEDTDDQRLHDQESDHELAHARRDRLPRSEDADRDQERGEDQEEDRDPVHAQVVADVVLGQPRHQLDELEFGRRGVEIGDEHDREREGDHRSPERHVTGIGRDLPFVAPDQQDEENSDQRQERDGGQDRPVGHAATCPRSETKSRWPQSPSSIAKA